MKIFDDYSRFCFWLARAALSCTAVLLVVMTALTGWQVGKRYLMNAPEMWSEQLCLLLIVYCVMLGAAVCLRERYHLGLHFFKDSFPHPLRKMLEGLVSIFTAFFGGCMIKGGLGLWALTFFYPLPTLPIPTGFLYLPFVASGSLIILFSIEQLLALILKREAHLSWN